MLDKFIYKITIGGASQVGKTTLIQKFVQSSFTSPASTVGIKFHNKTLTEFCRVPELTLALWDMGGQTQFQFIRGSYYGGAVGGMFVFDLTEPETARSLKTVWYPEFEHNADHCFDGKTGPRVMLGNKSDLPTREVDFQAGSAIALERDADYLETSAKTGKNVEAAFKTIAAKTLYQKVHSAGYALTTANTKKTLPNISTAYVNTLLKTEVHSDAQISLLPAPAYEKLTATELSDQILCMDPAAYATLFPSLNKTREDFANQILKVDAAAFESFKITLLPEPESYARVIEAVPAYKAETQDGNNCRFYYKN